MAPLHPDPLFVDDIDQHGDVILVFNSNAVLHQRESLRAAHRLQHTEVIRIPESSGHLDATPESPDPSLEQLVPGGDIRVRVSSEILKRKSPVFKVFLNGRQSQHAVELANRGQVELFDEDSDPEAFCFILNFFYDNLDNIPGFGNDVRLEFDTWLEALVIIDRYDLHRATRLLKREWWHLFSRHMPQSIEAQQRQGTSAELRNWICAAHVMNKEDELEQLYNLYKHCSTGPFDDDALLPLPAKLQMAELQRLEAFSMINKLLVRYHRSTLQMDPDPVCQCSNLQVARDCDRDTLGRLDRACRRNGFLLLNDSKATKKRKGITSQPAPQVDPRRVSFRILSSRISNMHFGHQCAHRANKLAMELLQKERLAQEEQRQRHERNRSDPYMGGPRHMDTILCASTNHDAQSLRNSFDPWQALEHPSLTRPMSHPKRHKTTHAESSAAYSAAWQGDFGCSQWTLPTPSAMVDSIFGMSPAGIRLHSYPPPPRRTQASFTDHSLHQAPPSIGPGLHSVPAALTSTSTAHPVPNPSSWTAHGSDKSADLPYADSGNLPSYMSVPSGTLSSPIELDAPKSDRSKPAKLVPCDPSPQTFLRQMLKSIELKLSEPVPAYVPPIVLDDDDNFSNFIHDE